MTRAEAASVMGDMGVEEKSLILPTVDVAETPHTMVIVKWKNNDDSWVEAFFLDGKLRGMSAEGLD